MATSGKLDSGPHASAFRPHRRARAPALRTPGNPGIGGQLGAGLRPSRRSIATQCVPWAATGPAIRATPVTKSCGSPATVVCVPSGAVDVISSAGRLAGEDFRAVTHIHPSSSTRASSIDRDCHPAKPRPAPLCGVVPNVPGPSRVRPSVSTYAKRRPLSHGERWTLRRCLSSVALLASAVARALTSRLEK